MSKFGIKDSNMIARDINSRNARQSANVNAAASVVAVFVIGILGALMLIHFATPCVKGIC